jgi:hypothetical protein
MTFQRWSASSVSQFIADRSSHYTHGDKACRKICQCNKSNDSNRGTIVYGISSQVEQMGIDISCNGLILQIERIRKLRSDKHNSKWDCRSYELKNSSNPLLQSLHSSYGLDIGKNTRRASWQDQSSPPLSSSLFSGSVELYRPP